MAVNKQKVDHEDKFYNNTCILNASNPGERAKRAKRANFEEDGYIH